MKKKNLFQNIILIFAICLLSLVFFDIKTEAQTLSCRDLSSSPPIGTKCLQIQRIQARDGTDSFRSSFPDSWVITQVEPNVAVRFGRTDGPHIRFYDSNTKVDVSEAWNQAIKELEDLEASLDATNPENGQNNSYKYINDQLREFKSNRSIVSSIDTNRAIVEATVSAFSRCKTRTPLGCVDFEGGSFTVDLYIYREYIGTPLQVLNILNNTKDQFKFLNEIDSIEKDRDSILASAKSNSETPFIKAGNNGTVSCSQFCAAGRASGASVWGSEIGINVGSEDTRVILGQGLSGVCDCAKTSSLFLKQGNNGTVSCKVFCAGTQWGTSGVCVASFNNRRDLIIGNDDVPGLGNQLTCSCVSR